MAILVDTHALIWYINGSEELPESVRTLIREHQEPVFTSIASLWELTIKQATGRLDLKDSLQNIFRSVSKSNIEVLPISDEHLLSLEVLPFHHRDPFDRIIISQAINGKMEVISKDRVFKHYPITVIWN